MSGRTYTHSSKIPPSFVRYEKMNKNVIGLNWDAINRDRAQLSLKPHEMKTQYKDGKGEEIID